ncbi:Integral membrane protein SED5 [Saitoella coloradoensis]
MDRTAEFRSCVASIKNRSTNKSRPFDAQRLLASSPPPQTTDLLSSGHNPKTEFARQAAQIGRDINNTVGKLERLAALAKRKTLFDDRPVEISELTYIIKQDIAALNTSIRSLQSLTKSQRSGKQQQEHSQNVVVLLQSRLANASMSFKDVLEVRTKNMRESRQRTEQFMAATTSRPESAASFQTAPYANTHPHSTPAPPEGRQQQPPQKQDFLALDLGDAENSIGMGMGGHQQQQLALADPTTTYLDSRASAIETIESTIHELGSIFSQLAQMVSEQREQITRIDQDTEDIVSNVGGAQRELMKYYRRVSSNRMLMLKGFGVLIIFFLLWVLVS